MKKNTFLIFLLVLFFDRADACLNIYYSIDKDGHFHETEDYRVPFNKNFNFKLLEKHLLETEKKLLKEKSFQVLSDYAVYLMKAGKVDESLEILIALAHHHPNEYQIAANLGTAYELSGNPDSALTYIKRGMELNPESHKGSEWVHVKILETKINQRSEPDYLLKNTVLNLTEEQKKDKKICDQILIQVRERFPFCPGPDSIMANIMHDLGDCYANTVSIEYAKAIYQIAEKYYGETSEKIKNKIDEMTRLSSDYNTLTTQITSEGSSIKEKNIRYEKMMDDNNDPPYEINWDKINTDVDSLLNILGFAKIVFAEPDPVTGDQIDSPATTSEPEKSPDLTLYYITFVIALILMLIVFFIRRRMK